MKTPPTSTSSLDALFGKTRRAVLGALFSQPERSWHLRELARYAGVSPTMLSKEADSLSAAGIINEDRTFGRRMLAANRASPIFEELRGIARKTFGLADIVRDALIGMRGIEVALIFGSVARGTERGHSDIDVFVMGDAPYGVVAKSLSDAEKRLRRPVNPVVYSREEFDRKLATGNRFLSQMIASEKIFLIGDEDALRRTSRAARATRHAKAPRAKRR